MALPVNCHHIEGIKIVRGIPVCSELPLKERLLPFKGAEEVPHDGWVWTAYHLRGADYLSIPSQDVPLPLERFLYLNAQTLNFGGGPYDLGLALWPGGEWHGRLPFWRKLVSGSTDERTQRSSLDKAELWPFTEGSTLVVVDQHKGVAKVEMKEGKLDLSPAGPVFTGGYLLDRIKRGRKAGDDVGMRWGLRTLRTLARSFLGSHRELCDLLDEAAKVSSEESV